MPDPIARPSLNGAGCFGKLPALGDFVTRRLPREFVDPWDTWLRQALARSREQLGEAWLEVYLTSPVWRFALGPGVCGPAPWAGVTIPSVDGVGRYFPFTVAAPLPEGALPLWALKTQGTWYAAAQERAVRVLGEDFEPSRLEDDLATLGLPAGGTAPAPRRSATTPALAWCLSAPVAPDESPAAASALLEGILADLLGRYSIWWTVAGSARVAPSLLVAQGLPPVDGYASLLQGDWAERGWRPGLSWTSPGGVTKEHE